MSIMGYYDGMAVQVNKPLQMNQKVIIIPIESEDDWEESAEGGLHKYADASLIEQEKDAWRKAEVKKYAGK